MTHLLLIDPEVFEAFTPPRVPVNPHSFYQRHTTVPTRFGYYDADDTNPNAPRCDRCNELLHVHVWQLVEVAGDIVKDIVECERQS